MRCHVNGTTLLSDEAVTSDKELYDIFCTLFEDRIARVQTLLTLTGRHDDVATLSKIRRKKLTLLGFKRLLKTRRAEIQDMTSAVQANRLRARINRAAREKVKENRIF